MCVLQYLHRHIIYSSIKGSVTFLRNPPSWQQSAIRRALARAAWMIEKECPHLYGLCIMYISYIYILYIVISYLICIYIIYIPKTHAQLLWDTKSHQNLPTAHFLRFSHHGTCQRWISASAGFIIILLNNVWGTLLVIYKHIYSI